jgi:hypothetical protein
MPSFGAREALRRSASSLCGSLALPQTHEPSGSCRRCRVWPLSYRLHVRGFRETGDCRALLDAFRELRSNALRRADSSLTDRGRACRALASHVATHHVLARRVGRRC